MIGTIASLLGIGMNVANNAKNRQRNENLEDLSGAFGNVTNDFSNAFNSDNFSAELDLNNREQARINQEFLSRNTSMLKGLLENKGIDSEYLKKAVDSPGKTKEIENTLEELQPQMRSFTNSLNNSMLTQTGNAISNSTPKYQAPAYGRSGSKLKRVSKFSTRKI